MAGKSQVRTHVMFADDPEEQRSGGADGNTGNGAVEYP